MNKKLVEVTRSFTYKLNLGNYQSADFFCSQKLEVEEDKAEEASKKLIEFCKKEVARDVAKFKKANTKNTQQLQKDEESVKSRAKVESPEEQEMARFLEQLKHPKSEKHRNFLVSKLRGYFGVDFDDHFDMPMDVPYGGIKTI